MTAERARDEPQGAVARLHVRRVAPVDTRELCRLLAHPDWLGRAVGGIAGDGTQRIEADLTFSVGADRRRLTFSKAAFVDLRVAQIDLGCAADVAWRASSFAPLFPVFAGRLDVKPNGLVLDGYYEPPAGGVGLLVDRALLGYFAQKTGEWFLDRLADAARD